MKMNFICREIFLKCNFEFNKVKYILLLAIMIGMNLESKAQSLPAYLPGYNVIDADGNEYETIIIGNQQWTKRNLLTSHFSNGDSIPNVIDGTEWYLLTNNPTPAWSSISLDAQYDSLRGKLYNWYAVNDPRNICPIGWRTPSEADWDSLILFSDPLAELNTLGTQSISAGSGLKDTLNYLWNWGNIGATNATGFSARPAGTRGYFGNFYNGGQGIFLWANSEQSEFHAYFRGFDAYSTSVLRGVTNGIDNKTTGGSVRCVKGAPKIKGYLYNDLNNNCVRDEGETGIGNITLTINGANTNVQTNSEGYWFLDSLAIGSYSLAINNNEALSINCNTSFDVQENESGIFQFAASVADTSNGNNTSCSQLPPNFQTGLVGYWPFCGNANDESGNGNNGTVNGASLSEDRFGSENSAYLMYSQNSGGYISLEGISLTDTFTLSAWSKLDNYNDSYVSSIISRYSSSGIGYELNIDQPQLRGIYGLLGPENEPNNSIISNTSLPLSEWNHIAWMKSGLNSKIYLNASLIFETNEANSISIGSGNLFFGRSQWGGNPFIGSLDDIGIWNRALSAEEVQQLYTLNACAFTIYDTVTVTEIVYDTVSISTTDTLIIETLITATEPAQENTFLVYPNPAHTQITINNGNFGILAGYELRITNSLGQDVYNAEITQQEVTLDISTWGGNGLYILYIQEPNGNTIAVKQIVLQ